MWWIRWQIFLIMFSDVLILENLHVLLNLFKHTFTEVNLGFPRWAREVQMGEDWITWETHVAKRQAYHRPLHNACLEEAQKFPPSRWKVTSLPGTALRFCMAMLICSIMDFFFWNLIRGIKWTDWILLLKINMC